MEILSTGDRRRQALDKVRRERENTVIEIEAVDDAALSLDDTVSSILASLRPAADRAEAAICSFNRPGPHDALVLDAGLLFWLDPTVFERQLRARLKPLLPSAGLPPAERPKRIAALRAKLAELERSEEVELCKLESAGLYAERRPAEDLDIETILAVWEEV